MNLKYVAIGLMGVCACAAAVGCSGERTAGGSDEINVVASFFPLAEAAESIGGDRVAVTNLTPKGAEPHDMELTPDAMDVLLDADLVVYIGGGFQPALEDALPRVEGEVIDVLGGLPTRGSDPHVWLDPVLWKRVAASVGRALARVDGEGATTYQEREATYVTEIDAVHNAYQDGLDACERDLLVTAHDAFGYLAERYDLRNESISGISPEAEPDPKRLAEIADLVADEDVTTIYTETLVSPKVAESLARQAGVTTAVLDPLESDPGDGYAQGMRSNLDALREGLGCR